jgi:hypothetical protein
LNAEKIAWSQQQKQLPDLSVVIADQFFFSVDLCSYLSALKNNISESCA